jgi:hypothetical protein
LERDHDLNFRNLADYKNKSHNPIRLLYLQKKHKVLFAYILSEKELKQLLSWEMVQRDVCFVVTATAPPPDDLSLAAGLGQQNGFVLAQRFCTVCWQKAQQSLTHLPQKKRALTMI